MRFRPCTTEIAVALPVLGALMASTFALPIAKNRFRPERIPLPVEVVRQRVGDPLFRYAEVPVELKEGTAIPEPALVPSHPSDDEIIDRAHNPKVRLHHGVASAMKGRYNASESATAEQDEAPYEIEDIAPIEKRGILPDFTGEDEEFAQPVQTAPPVPEEQQESQVFDDPAFEEEFYRYAHRHGEKRARGVQESLDALLERGGEDWENGWKSSQDDHLGEAEVNAPHHKQVSQPGPTLKPRELIPDHFGGYVEVPMIPEDTATAKGVNNENIHDYLQNRFKPAPASIGDTPKYEVPAHLLPETFIDVQDDPEGYIERRTKHRLTVLDIKAEEPTPTAVPGDTASAAEAPAHSIDPTYTTPAGHIHLARPIIQH